MGTVVKMVVAFCIGAALLSTAQRYWMTAMVERVNDPAYRVELPKPEFVVPEFGADKMQKTLYPTNRSLSGGFPSR